MVTNSDYRNNPLFLRNQFKVTTKNYFPIIKKQEIDIRNLSLIGFNQTKSYPRECNKRKNYGVHFFMCDYAFQRLYNNPWKYDDRLSQYACLLTPDDSTYIDMALHKQKDSIFRSRWMGAYWQTKGFKVIPTISWSNSLSFDFCFEGIEEGCIVAVSTLGCKHSKIKFMKGFQEMKRQIKPTSIICYDKPFKEMDDVIFVPHLIPRKEGI